MAPDTASAPSSLPWDTTVGNRFSRYSPEDHSAPLWVASFLGLVYIIGVLLLRAFIKRRVFGWDDYLIAASSIFATCQSAVICIALRAGLGKVPENVLDIWFIGKLSTTARVLWLLASYLAKLSVLSLLHRLLLRDQQNIKFIWNFCLGFTIAGGLVSILISTIGCPVSTSIAEHCSTQATRWKVITALDVATEGLALSLAPYMVWQLQMKVGNKMRVIVAFSFRLSIIILSILQLSSWLSYTLGPPSTFLIVPALVWQQVLLVTSLITATIPNLKAFLQSLSAGWGEPDFGYTRRAYGTGTFEMKNMHSGHTMGSTTGSHIQRVKQGVSEFSSQIHTSSRRIDERTSLGSSGSQDMIIRKEMEFKVERE